MSKVTIQGDASGTGTFTISAPNGNTDRTLVLPDEAGTLVTTASLPNPLTLGTAVASTSGTAIDFTGIPSWVKKITVMFNGVSTNGSGIRIQLGDSGGIENTGYVGYSVKFESGNVYTASSSGFDLGIASASTAISGLFVLTTLGSNLWVISGTVGANISTANIIGGTKTISDTLTQVRITTVNGTDTFDAGSINIMYE